MSVKNNSRPGEKSFGNKSTESTDFDAILWEGFEALAKKVQEHHEYLKARSAKPGRGPDDENQPAPSGDPQVLPSREPERGSMSRLPVLDEEVEANPAAPLSSSGSFAFQGSAARRVMTEPATVKADEAGTTDRKYDLLKRWKTMEGLKSQDPSAVVATALYQQDETDESIEGSDAEDTSSDCGGPPGPARRCVKRVNTCMTPWMLSPNLVVRSCWDSLACFFVIYECIMIPLAFFDFGESTFLDVIGWIVRLFWSIDFPSRASLVTISLGRGSRRGL